MTSGGQPVNERGIMTTKQALIHAVTEYDRRASKRRGYNPYALGQYMERIDEICADIERGAPVRKALCAGLSDRLLDHCLKAVGEQPFTVDELGGSWTYQSVTK